MDGPFGPIESDIVSWTAPLCPKNLSQLVQWQLVNRSTVSGPEGERFDSPGQSGAASAAKRRPGDRSDRNASPEGARPASSPADDSGSCAACLAPSGLRTGNQTSSQGDAPLALGYRVTPLWGKETDPCDQELYGPAKSGLCHRLAMLLSGKVALSN